jgi:exodeoxyribonuclease V alpha subunit
MELTIERCLAERMFKLAGVAPSPELVRLVMNLVEGAKDGHLCSLMDATDLPESLCSFGDDKNPFPKTPLVRSENRLYLQKNWAIETLILDKVKQLRDRKPQGLDKEVFDIEIAQMTSLQEAQVKALYMGFENSLAIFTGGPGTGKTFTASCFIRLLATQKTVGYKVVIAAPTGKAAAHLEGALKSQGPLPDALRCESMTLHRLLKLQPGMQRFKANLVIDADLVVVDEASMLDPPLLLHLLNAIGPTTRLLLLGDPCQLPPIEGGSLFPEMAACFGQKLERSIRMGDGDLFQLSQSILGGDLSAIGYESISWDHVIDRVCEIMPNPVYASEPDPRQCLELQKQFRILCALRQGPFGVDSLNQQLVSRFKDKQGWLCIPILIIENNPKQQLYNGSTGVLIRSKAYFLFGTELRMIPETSLPRYEPAFFLSVHKSQGSEFDEVVAVFPPGSDRFGREALYTAVTRAKKRLSLWIDAETLESAIQSSGMKRSGFSARL